MCIRDSKRGKHKTGRKPCLFCALNCFHPVSYTHLVLRNDYVKLERGGETIVLAGVDDPNGPYAMKTPAALMEEIRAQEGERCV